ncbi:hypothetical protein RRG08_019474 [Elysia crispata]|uniref:Uncharacterized protein n=1 Tax=Elysia crispata TaxID=231223 RepID=A0AAE1DUG9_9GAST|nr:hypothetical protein RRG08_019474 [Elysia crispata]
MAAVAQHTDQSLYSGMFGSAKEMVWKKKPRLYHPFISFWCPKFSSCAAPNRTGAERVKTTLGSPFTAQDKFCALNEPGCKTNQSLCSSAEKEKRPIQIPRYSLLVLEKRDFPREEPVSGSHTNEDRRAPLCSPKEIDTVSQKRLPHLPAPCFRKMLTPRIKLGERVIYRYSTDSADHHDVYIPGVQTDWQIPRQETSVMYHSAAMFTV